MKTVILCGGLGTRLSEETQVKPKPMVEIGGRPILWHIMHIYYRYDFNDFILALGYKGNVIKEYFMNYHSMTGNIRVHLASGKVDLNNTSAEDWHISMIDTGERTMTGGRFLRLKEVLKDEEIFMLTYGDGVADINIEELLKFHKSHGRLATVTAVRPPARFGGMQIEEGRVMEFKEKPQTGEGWINGGFFVFRRGVFDYLTDDNTVLEESPLENMARDGQLMAYEHRGFWQCMDTVRDRNTLNGYWNSGTPPWKTR